MNTSMSPSMRSSPAKLLAAASFAALVTVLPAVAQDMPAYQGVDDLPEIYLTSSEGSAPPSDRVPLLTIKELVDYVAEASKGKIKIEVYWSGSLMNYIEAPEGIINGVADMGQAFPVYTPADFPISNWLNTLTNQLKGGQPFGKLVALGANAEFWATNDVLRKEYEDKGLHILGAAGATAYDLLCNKEVRNLQDALGTQTRTANQAVAKEVESMGLASVSIVANEIYEAFSRGIVKCLYLAPALYMTQGLTDVPGQLYWLHLDLSGWMSAFHLINKAKWDALPPVARQILTDGYVHFLTRDAEITYAGTRRFGEVIRTGKVIPIQPDPAMLDALHKHQAAELEALVANAPPGVEDPKAVVEHYLSLLDKWRNIVSNELKIPDVPENAEDVVDAWFTDYDFKPFQRRLTEELTKANLENK